MAGVRGAAPAIPSLQQIVPPDFLTQVLAIDSKFRAMHTLTAPLLLTSLLLALPGCASLDPKELSSCWTYVWRGPRDVAADRSERFLGKVREDTASLLRRTIPELDSELAHVVNAFDP